MAKFNENQVLKLFKLDLSRRLKFDEEYLLKVDEDCLPKDLPDFRLCTQSRIALLKDLIDCLEFYSNYEFD